MPRRGPNPDGWSRNPDNTWTPPLQALQHPPESQTEVPPNVKKSTVRDGAVEVRDADDDLVVRMGKLADGSYGLELVEGGLTINQLSGTTLTVKDDKGSARVIIGEHEGDFDVKVFDDAGTEVKLSTLAFGLGANSDNNAARTTSGSFGDPTTGIAGPSVVVEVGPSGRLLVFFGCEYTVTSNDDSGSMCFAISGATTVAADDSFRITFVQSQADAWTVVTALARATVVTGLNEGSHTVKCVYRNDSGGGANTGSFDRRFIAAQPF